MERTKYPLNYEWHAAVNRHSDAWRKDGKEWSGMSFMYEAKSMADEVPRMVMLFKAEREKALPQTHQQCSMQAPVPVEDNHLSCCLGVKARASARICWRWRRSSGARPMALTQPKPGPAQPTS